MSVQQKGRSKHKIEVWNSSQCVLPTFKELKLIDIECITSIAPEHGKRERGIYCALTKNCVYMCVCVCVCL